MESFNFKAIFSHVWKFLARLEQFSLVSRRPSASHPRSDTGSKRLTVWPILFSSSLFWLALVLPSLQLSSASPPVGLPALHLLMVAPVDAAPPPPRLLQKAHRGCINMLFSTQQSKHFRLYLSFCHCLLQAALRGSSSPMQHYSLRQVGWWCLCVGVESGTQWLVAGGRWILCGRWRWPLQWLCWFPERQRTCNRKTLSYMQTKYMFFILNCTIFTFENKWYGASLSLFIFGYSTWKVLENHIKRIVCVKKNGNIKYLNNI